MIWVLALAGVALCGAGCVQNGPWVYLWIPGIVLVTWAFALTTNRPNPRPGYIYDQERSPRGR